MFNSVTNVQPKNEHTSMNVHSPDKNDSQLSTIAHIVSSNTQFPSTTAPSLENRINAISPTKIETSEVFDNIRSKMCLIEGPNGKASGFFINEKGLLVTTFHCLSKKDGEEGKFQVFSGNLLVTYIGKKYKVKFPEDFNATKANDLDLCLLQLTSSEEIKTNCFDLLPTSVPIKEGMKTYFAGFPLTQSVVTFHKGFVSSIFTQHQAQYFTIDGTVVPGNSGGPVVITHNNKLYLAGVVFAEVVDLDPDFLFLENSFAIMQQQGGVGGIKIGLPYPDGKVRSTSPMDIISKCLTVVKRNMSTGIGKAVHVQHIRELLSDQTHAFFLIGPEQSTTLDSELPVVHGTLQVALVSREGTKKVPKEFIENAIRFISSFNKPAKKEELYAQLWGSIGTIYKFDGCRLDRQSPATNAANLQIQVEKSTIATLTIDDKLAGYSGNKGKIAEVVNYVVRQFISALNYYKNNGEAIVLQIKPRI